ncbi:TlpA family protein disulfide reductase [Pseudoflavitalea sp. X16]|uniref:TlpA disulfide reductase family protein n=1 Tax=Paraflavitalea devenefica TaxID=2716334 RepID=UPI00141E9F9B|nr:TlpA disulfide reductase family protein [Paraflavitalea devenefica]NII29065.1 TlpA family protein disulfide reductase [Paraflavitalea devenefica]
MHTINVCLLAGLLLTGAATTAQSGKPTATLNIGDPAPSIQVKKWFKGQPVTSFEKGKIYVVEFWATWCQPCIAGMPHLSELAEKYKKEVTVAGISILERKTTTLAHIGAFIDSMGKKMNYAVAAEDSNFMAANWLRASGERGIPMAYVVDRNGRIAWAGLPKLLDNVLPKVIDGSWDIKATDAARKEAARLTEIDNSIIPVLNSYMGNPGKPDSALIVINQLLAKDPGLKYYPRMAHYTIYSLLKTDQEKALIYIRELLKAVPEPPFRSVTDAISYMSEIRKVTLIKGLYEIAAVAYEEQLERYPWSMDFPATYDNIAALQFKAGNQEKAVAAETRAIEYAKKKPGFPADKLAAFESSLQQYSSKTN